MDKKALRIHFRRLFRAKFIQWPNNRAVRLSKGFCDGACCWCVSICKYYATKVQEPPGKRKSDFSTKRTTVGFVRQKSGAYSIDFDILAANEQQVLMIDGSMPYRMCSCGNTKLPVYRPLCFLFSIMVRLKSEVT